MSFHEAVDVLAVLRVRAVRLGIAGAVVTTLCLGTLMTFAAPPFLSADESAHASYALDVMEGRLPTVKEAVDVDLAGQRRGRQHVAQHPPLYYALVGPVLAWAEGHDHDVGGVRVARLLSVALAGVTVVLAGVFAGMVVRRRRAEAAIIAAGLVATVPAFVGTAAAIHNDLLAAATLTLTYIGAAAALADRPRLWNVGMVCAGSGLTMATRLSGLGIVAVTCLGLGLAALLRTGGGARARLLCGGVFAGLPVLAAAATSGWYYLRNERLYGDYAGISYGRAVGGRVDMYTPVGWLTDPRSFPDLLSRTEGGGAWNEVAGFGWYDRRLLVAAVALVGLGALLGAGRVLRSLRTSSTGREEPPKRLLERLDPARLCVLGMLALLPAVAVVQMAGFVAQTGAPHPRYLFGVLPVVATVAAVCCLAFRRAWGVAAGMGIVALQAALTVTTAGRRLSLRLGTSRRSTPLGQLEWSLDQQGVPAAGLVLALLLAGTAAGIAVQAYAAGWLLRRDPPG